MLIYTRGWHSGLLERFYIVRMPHFSCISPILCASIQWGLNLYTYIGNMPRGATHCTGLTYTIMCNDRQHAQVGVELSAHLILDKKWSVAIAAMRKPLLPM
jgi:hypothetical protein